MELCLSPALRRIVLLFAAVAFGLLGGFVVFASSIMRFDPQTLSAADGIVVLTGGELRVREGLRIFADGAGRRILISGVNRATSKDELQRLSGVTQILFDCCVDVGYSARDTIGNAAEARAWLKIWNFRSLIVVTSNYHMPRSLAEFRRALPGIEIVPHVVQSRHYQANEWWRHPSAVKLVLTEYLKFLPAAVRLAVMQRSGDAALLSPPAQSKDGISSRPPRLSGL